MRNERYLKESYGRYYVNKPFLRKLIIKYGGHKRLVEKVGVGSAFFCHVLKNPVGRITEKSARKLLKKLGPKILLGRNPIYMPNSEYIKAQMAARGLTFGKTAESLDVSCSTLWRILGGERFLRPKTVQKLIKFFGKESVTKE